MSNAKNLLRWMTAALALPLAGCNAIVLHAPGDVAHQQGTLILVATGLMLLVIIPVIALTLLFAWRYRSSNDKATYHPDWDHSIQLELLIWAVPLLIIIALGAVTWISTHTLDPYRPLERISAGRAVPAGVKPLEVDVIALDWKWLFIYPEQDIASVNDMAAPVDRPIHFHITAASVMNAFYVPALAGMIYAMPSMETTLYAVMNKPGDYTGVSSNFSGPGFSDMHFRFHATDADGFATWVAQAKAAGSTLDRAGYMQLAKPSERDPVHLYAAVEDGLYQAILERCVDPSRPCMPVMGKSMADSHPDSSSMPMNSAGSAPIQTPATHASAAAEPVQPHVDASSTTGHPAP